MARTRSGRHAEPVRADAAVHPPRWRAASRERTHPRRPASAGWTRGVNQVAAGQAIPLGPVWARGAAGDLPGAGFRRGRARDCGKYGKVWSAGRPVPCSLNGGAVVAWSDGTPERITGQVPVRGCGQLRARRPAAVIDFQGLDITGPCGHSGRRGAGWSRAAGWQTGRASRSGRSSPGPRPGECGSREVRSQAGIGGVAGMRGRVGVVRPERDGGPNRDVVRGWVEVRGGLVTAGRGYGAWQRAGPAGPGVRQRPGRGCGAGR
ncbi:hypothetical protein CLV40_14123 [Actinokineospora auranticolor]|uniref:Uncharacterized protein n=1 Tax=Actinokineospora auranticolor TaxID=155976 RepID=A0A2S6GC63_9PSEU|nr:hypothetical protein CLV40_14123 [Actinokineospora auranticolor]